MKIKVGFQGRNGTFSEIAAMQYFRGRDYEAVGYPDFRTILADVENGSLDYAVLPVENTTTGVIARCYDLFRHYRIHAVGEIDIPIYEDLIVVPGTSLEEIREVYSHPEALSQCSEFFAAHPWMEARAAQDTARGVEYVRDCNDRTKAALGSWRAGEYYGMESLLAGVQDNDLNMTRFLIVTAKEETDPAADKISMMLVLRHRPGALYNILGILAKNGINILKLESRPIPGRIFEYMFYIDFSGNTGDRTCRAVIRELEQRCEETKILGCYKAADPEKFSENKS